MQAHNLFDLTGKVALITGGGRGIGKTAAGALGSAGARVVITGRRAEYLASAAEELSGMGITCEQVVADVTQPDDIARTLDAALAACGAVDILVNNAGQTWGQPTKRCPSSAGVRSSRSISTACF